MGKVVMLDLTTQTVTEYPWTDEQRKLYIGGKIMAAKILCDNFTGQEKPFSEENLIVITTGPMTGTGAPSSGRFNMSCLSPQTGFITSSNCGGSFGYFLKRAGMDALIIRGKCDKHTWIIIENDKFTFRDADEADVAPTHYVHESGKTVVAGEKILLHMASGGGFIIRFANKKEIR